MRSSSSTNHGEALRRSDNNDPALLSILALLLWLAAGVIAFLPFAFNTSPWDALTLDVAGHQGNWWHALVGLPFFLAFPMIWLRLRSLVSEQSPSVLERRIIWCLVSVSGIGTVAVETPFLLHLAGTKGWPSLSMLIVGLGVLMVSAVVLLRGRRWISPMQACLIGLSAAYLANLSLVLIVYSTATGSDFSRIGWLVAMVIVWPMALELIWLYSHSFRTRLFGQRSA